MLNLIVQHGMCSVTPGAAMPNDAYVKDIAEREFGVNFGTSYPLMLVDLYAVFSHLEYCTDNDLPFKVENVIIPKSKIRSEIEKLGHDFKDFSNYYSIVTKMILNASLDQVPGYSPLSRALYMITFVANAPTSQYNARDLYDYEKLINDQIISEGVNNLRNYDSKPVQNDSSGRNDSAIGANITLDVGVSIRDAVHSISPTMKIILSDNPTDSISINKALIASIKASMYIRELMGSVGTNQSVVEFTYDNRGKIKKTENLTRFSQINKTPLVSRVRPDFKQKLFKKQLTVKEKIAPRKSKQGIIVLEDNSGSMQQLWKQSYIRGIMLKLLELVVDGHAELEHSHYSYDIYNTTSAKDISTAQAMYKRVAKNVPNECGTNIANVLQKQVDILDAKVNLVNKELFILLDGEDKINPDNVNPKGVVINAICLGVNNPGVRAVCEKSGGNFIAIVLPNA